MEASIARKNVVVRVICIWCGKELGEAWARSGVAVSHSICPGCLEQIRRPQLAVREAG